MSQQARTSEVTGGSYQLDSLLLMILLCAVWFAVLRLVPSMAYGSLTLILPSLLRTVLITRRRNAALRRVPSAEKISLFIESLGAVTLIVLATGSLFLMIGYTGLMFARYVHEVYASDVCAILVLLLALGSGSLSSAWAGYAVALRVCPDQRFSGER